MEISRDSETDNDASGSEEADTDETDSTKTISVIAAPPPPPPGFIEGPVLEVDPAAGSEVGGNIKYDDAEWHEAGIGFPDESPPEYGGVHIGFYLAWAVERNLASKGFLESARLDILAVERRIASPIRLLEIWDGKLVSDMLNDEGNRFSQFYYGGNEPPYLVDYTEWLEQTGQQLYAVAPTWENYDSLKPALEESWAAWRADQSRE